jgi:N-methylhydantoinase A
MKNDQDRAPAADTSVPETTIRIGVDTGGTFTDFIVLAGGQRFTFKVPSTPRAPEEAILAGIGVAMARLGESGRRLADPGWSGADEVIHGTTVGTNALLERKGARTALVTTAGFEDVLEIGRQARPEPYNLGVTRPEPLIPRSLRFGVRERILADGTIREELAEAEIERLLERLRRARVESVAVALLFSFVNPVHETRLEGRLRELGVPLSISSRILPEYREYERISTLALNAWLAPKMSGYLGQLTKGLGAITGGAGPRLRIMQSSGGSISAEVAAREPVRTILSGPAGGVVAAERIAALAGIERIITFDMGGTSTDVAVCQGGAPTTSEAQIGGVPIAVPVLDIHTVGAGGGSIAFLDAGGALRVGPESAGADPGPAAYGRGERPTVTDANLVLGRFAGRGLLNGGLKLDEERARQAIARLAEGMSGVADRRVSVVEAALGVVRVANSNMERALRLVSVERGHDPRLFTLAGFGGGGGLHAAALAEALRIPRVLIPADPGAFSALGLLLAEVIKDYSRTVMAPLVPSDSKGPLPVDFRRRLAELERLALAELAEEGFSPDRIRLEPSLAIRYRGQSYELAVPLTDDPRPAFHALHRARYGHADPARGLEVVSLRLRAIGLTTKPILTRQPLRRGARVDPRSSSMARVWFGRRAERVPVYERTALPVGARLTAPAIVVEYGSTTLLPPGWQLEVDGWRNLILTSA